MQSPVPKSDDLDALIGSVVAGKYRIDRVLGRGGMGAVFSATNATIGKRVALKFLTREAARDKSATQRFQREAEAAGVIESEHIVHVFDSGTTEDGLPFLVMELLAGEDLRSRLQREGMLSVPQAVDISTQVLRGLVRAHAAGIVHRDLKPDNVFLCRRDDGATLAKIVDFGISKLSHGRSAKTLTRRGTVLGTAYYMAPEQAQAAEGVDHRADLYGVGTLLFEMLAGRPPHVAPTHEAVLVAICTKNAPNVQSLRPDTPTGLARLIERALARDRDARIGSAEEFLEELGGTPGRTAARAFTAKSGTDAPLVSSTTERRRIGTRRTVVAGVIAALLGFTLTAVLVARGRGPAKAPAAESLSSATPTGASAPPTPARAPVEVIPLTHVPSALAPASASADPRSIERRTRPSPGKDAQAKAVPASRAPGAADAGVGRTLTLSTREP